MHAAALTAAAGLEVKYLLLYLQAEITSYYNKLQECTQLHIEGEVFI